MNEEWRPVKSFEGLYEISNKGRLKSLDREVPWGINHKKLKGQIISESIGKDGYIRTTYGGTVFSGDKPCCTITKGKNIKFFGDYGEYNPDIDDIKTLCGFPRDYKLIGSYSQKWARLGNAVAPPLMEAIVKHLRETVLDQINLN